MSSSEDKLFLAELIEVTQISENLFTGNCLPGATGRVFGGQVAAQAMRSATLIRPASRDIHSYSCIFLRPGKPEFEVRYIVSELRNGKSLTTYRVDAYQDIDGDESLIMTSTSSFHIKEESQSYQDQMPDSSRRVWPCWVYSTRKQVACSRTDRLSLAIWPAKFNRFIATPPIDLV
jgi:acyl-CoA thioesterase-2